MRLNPMLMEKLAGEEEFAEGAVGAEAAEVGDGANGYFHVGKKRHDLLHPDMQDFIQNRASHRLAEAQFEKAARPGEAGGQRFGGQPVARFAAYDFNGLEDTRLASPMPHR